MVMIASCQTCGSQSLDPNKPTEYNNDTFTRTSYCINGHIFSIDSLPDWLKEVIIKAKEVGFAAGFAEGKASNESHIERD